MLPKIRRRLAGDASKNASLRDILKSTGKGVEVVSVRKITGGIHNTEVIIKTNNWVNQSTAHNRNNFTERACYYNRLNIANLLHNVVVSATTIEGIISELNKAGYDFTTDDLELVGGKLTAKLTSLGYYGEVGGELAPPEEIHCIGLDYFVVINIPVLVLAPDEQSPFIYFTDVDKVENLENLEAVINLPHDWRMLDELLHTQEYERLEWSPELGLPGAIVDIQQNTFINFSEDYRRLLICCSHELDSSSIEINGLTYIGIRVISGDRVFGNPTAHCYTVCINPRPRACPYVDGADQTFMSTELNTITENRPLSTNLPGWCLFYSIDDGPIQSINLYNSLNYNGWIDRDLILGDGAFLISNKLIQQGCSEYGTVAITSVGELENLGKLPDIGYSLSRLPSAKKLTIYTGLEATEAASGFTALSIDHSGADINYNITDAANTFLEVMSLDCRVFTGKYSIYSCSAIDLTNSSEEVKLLTRVANNFIGPNVAPLSTISANQTEQKPWFVKAKYRSLKGEWSEVSKTTDTYDDGFDYMFNTFIDEILATFGINKVSNPNSTMSGTTYITSYTNDSLPIMFINENHSNVISTDVYGLGIEIVLIEGTESETLNYFDVAKHISMDERGINIDGTYTVSVFQ